MVTLTWTVPVADDAHGYVAGYDLRYTTFEPDSTDWDSAIQVDNEPIAYPAA